ATHKGELKRSVIFVAFAGEEEGYLGSEAYIARMAASPGRLESLVAMLNLDVIGCCGETLEASNESSALVDRLRAAAEPDGVTIALCGTGRALGLDVGERVVDVAHEALRLGRRSPDAGKCLVQLDGVLPQVLLEAMETEPERLRAVPEPGRRVDLTVADVAKLPQHTDVYLGEGVTDLIDGGAVDRRHRGVALRYVRRAVLVPLRL